MEVLHCNGTVDALRWDCTLGWEKLIGGWGGGYTHIHVTDCVLVLNYLDGSNWQGTTAVAMI